MGLSAPCRSGPWRAAEGLHIPVLMGESRHESRPDRALGRGQPGGMAVTHKRFLWNGEHVVPACGAVAGKDVSLSDQWAVVTCQKCLRCRPSGGLVGGGFLVFVGTCLALFGWWVGATQGWPMGLFPTVSFVFSPSLSPPSAC